MLLKDKVVVISGVGPGLGQTMAKMACTEGAAVILGARNQSFWLKLLAKSRHQVAGYLRNPPMLLIPSR